MVIDVKWLYYLKHLNKTYSAKHLHNPCRYFVECYQIGPNNYGFPLEYFEKIVTHF